MAKTIIMKIGGSVITKKDRSTPVPRPNVMKRIAREIKEVLENKEINLIINTPIGRSSKYDDGYIRRMAIQHKIPYITTIAAAQASVEGIEAALKTDISPKALQDYYKDLKGKKEKEMSYA